MFARTKTHTDSRACPRRTVVVPARFSADPGQPPNPAPRRTRRVVVTLAVILALLLAGFVIYLPNLSTAILGSGTSGSLSTQTTSRGSSSLSSSIAVSVATIQALISPPTIQNGSASVPYPSNYNTLAAHALGVINQDRKTYGLTPVTLSPVSSAQQHADSMLYFGYFSHFDTQGYKPYMRYTLLGGVGATEENIAFISWQSPYYTDIGRIEKSIDGLEHSMMYNDSFCCHNGHRDNILSQLHNRVSIGVAYNTTALFFVEDFENHYVDLEVNLSGSSISMKGTPLTSSLNSSTMAVFYDPAPRPENVSVLNQGPREYDPGTLIGGVFPPCSILCPYSQAGITVYADSWQYTATGVKVSFTLTQFIQRYGAGVYTLYLLTGANESSTTANAITSISIFVG
jgi:uncharacterized protein YkwD